MNFDHFICPETGRPLRRADDALTGGGKPFPIVRGVPRFVHSDNYAEAFGLQWKTFKRTQFDSHTGQPITEDRLAQAYGRPLEELSGKRVLEAGSGAGRFTEILLKHGAHVFSFDFSDAVDANADNNLPHPNLTLFQGDIRNIPFPDDFFDAVFCLGVLQHTPSPLESLRELTRVTRFGGSVIIDHYKWHLGNFTSLYLPWWFAIKQFTPRTQMRITDTLSRIFFPIHWAVRKSPLAQMCLRRISPINFYYGAFDLPKETLYEWTRLDTHDRNTDHFKRHVTAGGLRSMLSALPLDDVEVFVGGTGYVGRGRKSFGNKR